MEWRFRSELYVCTVTQVFASCNIPIEIALSRYSGMTCKQKNLKRARIPLGV